jgi:hypothetical protein
MTPLAKPEPNGCAAAAATPSTSWWCRPAIRLAQWVGRAIRTEEDQAHVYCYDRRLTGTSYGQLLIKGLPPFTLQKRPVQCLEVLSEARLSHC